MGTHHLWVSWLPSCHTFNSSVTLVWKQDDNLLVSWKGCPAMALKFFRIWQQYSKNVWVWVENLQPMSDQLTQVTQVRGSLSPNNGGLTQTDCTNSQLANVWKLFPSNLWMWTDWKVVADCLRDTVYCHIITWTRLKDSSWFWVVIHLVLVFEGTRLQGHCTQSQGFRSHRGLQLLFSLVWM